MNWEGSKSCTLLKRDFLISWFAQEQRFFLTGGSALGLFYLDHRRSYDLDLFSTSEVDGKDVRNLVYRVAAEIGAASESLRSTPDFHRFLVIRGDEREVVDVVIDRAPQLDFQKADFGGIRVDTLREITANKLTTLLSRTETKDIVDLYFLEKAGLDLLASVSDAQLKDGGWEHAVVAMILDDVSISELPAWMIQKVDPADLQEFLKRLRMGIAELALPER